MKKDQVIAKLRYKNVLLVAFVLSAIFILYFFRHEEGSSIFEPFLGEFELLFVILGASFFMCIFCNYFRAGVNYISWNSYVLKFGNCYIEDTQNIKEVRITDRNFGTNSIILELKSGKILTMKGVFLNPDLRTIQKNIQDIIQQQKPTIPET